MVTICQREIEGVVKIYADGKTFFKEVNSGTLGLTTTSI